MNHRQIRTILNELEPYVLEDIEEVTGDHVKKSYRTGSEANVVELNWHGTRCVGKELHSVFFHRDFEPDGQQRIAEKFCKEINLLSKMKHPNIVQFMGLCYGSNSPAPTMVMEKMECSLTELINTTKKGLISWNKVINILSDVAKGLVYLHVVRRVAHRDLSSNNILIAPYCAKIADFGSARILDGPAGCWSTYQLTLQPGTQDFMPPEALENPPRYDFSVDVFSFGCVIIHLVAHQWPTPYGKTFGIQIISEWDRRKTYITDMKTNPLLSLVQNCLQDVSVKRPNSKEVLLYLEAVAKENSGIPSDHLGHLKSGPDLSNPTEVKTEFYTNKIDQLIAQCTKAQLCIQDVSKECVEFRQQCRKLKKDLTVSNETNEILLAEMDKLEAAHKKLQKKYSNQKKTARTIQRLHSVPARQSRLANHNPLLHTAPVTSPIKYKDDDDNDDDDYDGDINELF